MALNRAHTKKKGGRSGMERGMSWIGVLSFIMAGVLWIGLDFEERGPQEHDFNIVVPMIDRFSSLFFTQSNVCTIQKREN